MRIADFTDDQIVTAIHGGRRVHAIAQGLGVPDYGGTLRSLHRRLRKMEDAGVVHRCPRRSSVNSILWQARPHPTGQVQFEQILREARMTGDRITEIMGEQ